MLTSDFKLRDTHVGVTLKCFLGQRENYGFCKIRKTFKGQGEDKPWN
jgi:hypothetical protein